MDEQSFFSIDKLVEFGMGMSLAQQMMNTMNQCMAKTQIPTVQIGVPQMPSVQVEYYATVEGQIVGPLSESELSQLIQQKKITVETFFWKQGLNGWMQAKNVPEIYKHILLNK